MSKIDDIPCPACQAQWQRDIKYNADDETLRITCNQCGYEWDIPAYCKKTTTAKEAEKIIEDKSSYYERLAQTERVVGLIVDRLIEKIEDLSEEST